MKNIMKKINAAAAEACPDLFAYDHRLGCSFAGVIARAAALLAYLYGFTAACLYLFR